MTEDNIKLAKQLGDGFRHFVYWNKYKMIPNEKEQLKDGVRNIRKLLDSSFWRVKKLFLLVHDDSINDDDTDTNSRVKADSFKKYFLPRVNIENYNIYIDGKNFYDQPINDPIKKYDEVRKIATGQRDEYIKGCLLDYAYFDKNYKLTPADLSK